MIVYLVIFGWYLVGMIGCAIGYWVDFKKGSDFTLHDLLLGLFFSIGGAIMLLFGLMYLLGSIEIVWPTIPNKVLIKVKK